MPLRIVYQIVGDCFLFEVKHDDEFKSKFSFSHCRDEAEPIHESKHRKCHYVETSTLVVFLEIVTLLE